MSLFKRVVLGMSGGVDSAVAGLLLKKKGYEVIGLFMRNWDIKDEQDFCSSDQDAEDAEWVCKQLQIPFQEVNFVREYWNEVFSYLLDEYQNGHTPNPDIYCNKYIKFNHFFKYSQEKVEADAISTGHYARSSFGDYLEYYNPNGGAKLFRPVDRVKDQTFFLSQIPQSALQRTMFPLGTMSKEVVRKIAKSSGLDRVATKKDSMGICFIGKRDFPSFISEYIKDRVGDFVDVETKEKVGEHRGLHHWTLGQRSKLQGFPWKYYTSSKDVESNIIYVARGNDHPALFSSGLYVQPFYWIDEPPEELLTNGRIECKFCFQHVNSPVNCVVTSCSSNPGHYSPSQDTCFISLAEPLRAITPGQFAVIYKGDECLGSAQIIRSGPSLYEFNVNNCREKIQSGGKGKT